jgi:hypothetical protein
MESLTEQLIVSKIVEAMIQMKKLPNQQVLVPQHFIDKNIPLDYTIRFQNTGTDTAFTVSIHRYYLAIFRY